MATTDIDAEEHAQLVRAFEARMAMAARLRAEKAAREAEPSRMTVHSQQVEWLSTSEAAQYFKLQPQRIEELCRSGAFTALQDGRRKWRIAVDRASDLSRAKLESAARRAEAEERRTAEAAAARKVKAVPLTVEGLRERVVRLETQLEGCLPSARGSIASLLERARLQLAALERTPAQRTADLQVDRDRILRLLRDCRSSMRSYSGDDARPDPASAAARKHQRLTAELATVDKQLAELGSDLPLTEAASAPRLSVDLAPQGES